MRSQSLLLASLLAGLYGCQPENPVQENTAPAETSSSASEPVSAVPADTAASNAAVERTVQAVADLKKAAPAQAVAAKAAPVAVKSALVPEKSAQAVTVVPDAVVKPEPAVKPAASEADAMALAKKNNCLVCHAIDKKIVGPAWKEVAAKYRGDATAEAYLVNKIARGGSGVWGGMAMPANPKISEADRTALARFLLNLK